MSGYFTIINYYLTAGTAFHLQTAMHVNSIDAGTESINRFDPSRNFFLDLGLGHSVLHSLVSVSASVSV